MICGGHHTEHGIKPDVAFQLVGRIGLVRRWSGEGGTLRPIVDEVGAMGQVGLGVGTSDNDKWVRTRSN